MRIQANISPASHSVDGLIVFIAYKTEQWEFVKQLRHRLQVIGFEVTVFEPADTVPGASNDEIRDMLAKSLRRADYLCLINSRDALSSDWVAFEFVQAAEILGRVLLINSDDNTTAGQHTADTFLNRSREFGRRGLHVKHTTVPANPLSDENFNILIKEMMNSPDERWYEEAGVKDKYNQLSHLTLKEQSDIKKLVRSKVLADYRFIDHVVLQIAPYIADDVTMLDEDEMEQKFIRISQSDGRLSLEKQYERREVFVLHADYDVQTNFRDSSIRVGVFVAIRPGAYPADKSRIEKGTFLDTRDGQRYGTVTINGRTWMTENLRFNVPGSWCYQDSEDCSTRYGRLYSWEQAADAVPEGWHLASAREWAELAISFGGYRSNMEPDHREEAELSYQALIEGGDSGIEITLAGMRSYSGQFEYMNVDGYYWSSTERGPNSACIMFFLGGAGETQLGSANKIAGHSVRCVKGESVDWSSQI